MIENKLIYRRNVILFILISTFYFIQVTINIFIEGLASIFPPVLLFIVFGIILIGLIHKKINPKITKYVMVSCMYIYFYFLLNNSPYLVNYLFMWLALPLSAIYQSFRVVLIAGSVSIILTLYSYFYFRDEIFPNVVKSDVIYLILFGIFITAFLIIFIHRIRKVNMKLQDIAYRDSLTGAANRLLLKEKFQLLKDKKVPSFALLFIDMNGFKRINDTYGHEVGDQVLENVVSRVNGVLRDADLLCRLGGDEFVILLSNIGRQVPERIAERVQLALEKPMEMNDQIIEVSASIGWTYTIEVSEADLENMLREADRAMYRAKGSELYASQSLDDI